MEEIAPGDLPALDNWVTYASTVEAENWYLSLMLSLVQNALRLSTAALYILLVLGATECSTKLSASSLKANHSAKYKHSSTGS